MFCRAVFLSGLLAMIFFTNLSAQRQQRAETICGEYTYYTPENVSIEQARKTALERAKTKALADKYGTNVTTTNVTLMGTENENVNMRFLSLGGSEVKGEWLEDTKAPEYKISYQNDMLVMQVSACGRVREIVGTAIDFSAKVLKNGTEDRFESDEFRSGDDIYLSFRSPMDGYLAVYLIDDAGTSYCLLPYRNDPTGRVNVKSGRDYIFFSVKHADRAEAARVDEYMLTCDKQTEINFIYVIFSPNEFIKANDMQANEGLPRELSFEDFQRWLTRNRERDSGMKVNINGLTIKK